jgi:2-polyprenyl-6-methoxyphenol hydroxylase-like FAD-dependent oxidoreductase
MAEYPIIVAGAGPVGLLVALSLARENIPVTILEALPAIEASPRAMVYQPVAVRELERAGVLDELRKISTQGRKICWRKTRTGEVIAELERTVTPDYPYENLVVGQHDLARVILEHLRTFECAKILYGQRVLAVDQSDKECIVVTTEGPGGKKETFKASYLVGADGGRSSVRRLCDIAFEGFTWPQQLVATNVYYPFDKYGFYDGNFMMYDLPVPFHYS